MFLIPFEVVGLAMLAALAMALLEPLRTTTWTFESHQFRKTNRWPFFQKSRSWDVVILSHLELRAASRMDAESLKNLSVAADDFQLAVVTDDNQDLCTVESLTQGEALWMAHCIMQEFPQLFRD